MKKRVFGVVAAALIAGSLSFGTAANAAVGDCQVWSGGGWLGGACPETVTPVPTERIGGPTKYDTPAMISHANYAPGVDVVYIAGATGVTDALAAAPVAATAGKAGPILLVPATGALPLSVDAELKRLNPKKVVVLGGTIAVSEGMLAKVTASANK